jgi:KDO2-lipid IV(A) lauroyltransferase
LVFRFLFWYPLRGLAPFLPGRVLSALAALCAGLLYATDRPRVDILKQEFSRLPNPRTSKPALNRLVRRSLYIFCMARIDLFRFGRERSKSNARTAILEGRDRLAAALGKKRGAIVLTPHFGSHMMVLPALSAAGFVVSQFATRQTVWKDMAGARQDRLSHRALEIADGLESRLPVRYIYDDASRRELYDLLARNEILAMGFDGRMGRRWAAVSFLGRRAYFATGPLSIAARTDAPLFLSFAVRAKGTKKQRIRLEGPWRVDREPAGMEAVLADMAACLERYVEKYPCHYGEFLRLMRSRSRLDERPFFEDTGP